MNRQEFLLALGAGAAAIAGGTTPAGAAERKAKAPGVRAIKPVSVKVSPEGTALPSDLCAALRHTHETASFGNGLTIGLGGHAWNLFPEESHETTVFPSNNDNGSVRTPFLLENLRDVTIDGEGASLMVRGTPQAGSGQMAVGYSPMVPFVIRNCHNVTLKNFSIDWATPAIVQGICVAADAQAGTFEVEFQADRKLWCWNGFCFLVGEGWTYQVHRLLMVDPDTGAVLSEGGDNMGAGYEVSWQTEVVKDNRIRFRGPVTAKVRVGAMILGWCTTFHTGARRAPAIFLDNCQSVKLEDVRIYHAWGMGVIAQGCTDVSLSRVVVEPSGQRRFSLTADATHFVHCRGTLEFDNCRFQNQFDDGINAHGLYRQIVRQLDKRTLRVRAVHPQHCGVRFDRAGDAIRLAAKPYVEDRGTLRLKSIAYLNSEIADLVFEGDIPATIGEGDFIENITAYPVISVRDSEFRWNRARGILINGKGPVEIRHNRFETAGSAIQVESSPMWGESGPVSDMRIVDNTFTGCTYIADWGTAVIQADPEVRRDGPKGIAPFHGRIEIAHNRFDACHAPATKLMSFREIVSDAG